jgi:hypothetical protein
MAATRERRPPRPRVFCIGLNKTGTVSLNDALTTLGYRTLHWGGPEVRHKVQRARREGRPLLSYLAPEVEAFSDIEELTQQFARLDEQYPGSRFILTVRPLTEWLDSRRRHVERNQIMHERGEYTGRWLEVDLAGWAADYGRHVAAVRSHFAGRDDDLLEIEITAGDGWALLCGFLGEPVPDVPFPWQNRHDPADLDDRSTLLPFTDATPLSADPAALRRRMAEDGYVYVRGAVPRDVLVDLRSQITAICGHHQWLVPGTDPLDAIAQGPPCVEGEDEYFAVYDEVQRLEAFHALAHHPSVTRLMTAVLGGPMFPHPLSIARLVFPRNDAWATPPHQDYPNNQGTRDLVACWIPLADCPVECGSLSVLRGSHRCGVASLDFALGPGNRRAVLDERFAGLPWVGGDFALGDALVFHSHTVHRALPNHSDRLRLSVDYRYQREGERLTAGCLEPHFARLSWAEIYETWTRDDLRYYWRTKRYSTVRWDDSLHALPDDSLGTAVRQWMQWRYDHPSRSAGDLIPFVSPDEQPDAPTTSGANEPRAADQED